MKRSSTDTGPEDDIELAKGCVLDESMRAAFLPEALARHLADGPGKVGAAPSPAPLEYGHRSARLS